MEKQVPTGMVAQSVICFKTRFKSLAAAKRWIKDHGFKLTHRGKAADETSTSYRFRQRDPGDFKDGTLRTVRIDRGVCLVVGKLKKTTKQAAGDLLDLL
jgi:hypothetical protein